MPKTSRNNALRHTCRATSGGFTLIEVAVVIAVLAVAAAIVVPEFRQITDANVKSQAGILAGAVEYANTQAVTRRRIYRLYFDFNRSKFWLEAQTPKGFKETKSLALGRAQPLLDGVSFESVLAVDTIYKKGQTYLEFLPDGTTDPAILCVQSQHDDHWGVRVDPDTAMTQIDNECPDPSTYSRVPVRDAQ